MFKLELKEEEFPELFEEEKKREKNFVEDTLVETDLNILIPENYLPSVAERLNFYNRIAASKDENELRIISRELIDRFGPIPKEVLDLFDTVRIRRICKHLGYEKVVLKRNVLRLYFPSNKESSYYSSPLFPSLLSWVQANHHRANFKESPKYLSMVIKGIQGIKGAFLMLKEIEAYVDELQTESVQ